MAVQVGTIITMSPFYWWGNQGMEKFRKLGKTISKTKPVSDGGVKWTWAIQPPWPWHLTLVATFWIGNYSQFQINKLVYFPTPDFGFKTAREHVIQLCLWEFAWRNVCDVLFLLYFQGHSLSKFQATQVFLSLHFFHGKNEQIWWVFCHGDL